MNIFLKLLLFILASCLWIWAFIIEPHIILDVEEVPIKIEKWDSNLDNLKIAVVGDIHAGKPFFEDWRVKKIVDKINSLSPDIVLLVGDYVNGGWYQSSMNLEKLASLLSKIKAPLGVYAILGNHDYLYGAGQIRKMINSTNIKLLENSNAKVDTPKGSFYISGIADPLSADYSYSQALKGIGKNSPVIFLSHTPDVFREIPSEASIAFSGHTHGGQVKLPFIGALFSNTFAKDKLIEGEYRNGPKTIFVTRGLGTSRLPVRFLCTPVISLITLSKTVNNSAKSETNTTKDKE